MNVNQQVAELKCVMADRRMAQYKLFVNGNERKDVAVIYDENMDEDYPWYPTPVDVKSGRLLSSVGYSYRTRRDVVEAILDGSWRE